MAAISRGLGRLRSNSQTRCPSPLAISLPSFAAITRIDLEKVQKNNMISGPENGRHYPWSRSFEVKFADKVLLTTSNVPAKFHWRN